MLRSPAHEVRMQTRPNLSQDAKVAGQAHGGVSRDAMFLQHNLADAPGRKVNLSFHYGIQYLHNDISVGLGGVLSLPLLLPICLAEANSIQVSAYFQQSLMLRLE